MELSSSFLTMFSFQTQVHSWWNVSGECWASVDRVGEWNLWQKIIENVDPGEQMLKRKTFLLLPQDEEKKEKTKDKPFQ